MLIKEYRICMPLSVDEYRVAQLYMIQKKSKNESTGQGSGVEIIKNEPYFDGPGGSGQYTLKIFHIDNHLPGWFRNILPKSAMIVEEEAWNAYPYTKTKYKVPIIDKFSLDLETYYYNDAGEQDNVFILNDEDRKNRIVDYLDMVADPICDADYKIEEDPKIYISTKTNRGPLKDTWRSDYRLAKSDQNSGKSIMCAYKLCKIEFKYWGMQTKVERFIDETALRKTMLRAHRQVWCWQDEWIGLTIEDIRLLEIDTALELSSRMRSPDTLHSTDQNDQLSKECLTEIKTRAAIQIINDPDKNKNSSHNSENRNSSLDSDDDNEDFFDANEFQPESTHLTDCSIGSINIDNAQ